MEPDHINKLFRDLESEWDVETPNSGHEQRFLERLNAFGKKEVDTSSKIKFYKIGLAMAASIVICFGLFLYTQNTIEGSDLASVSPELSQTQDFFIAAITSELNKIKAQRNPENEVLISDALKQINVLEKNYERLKIDLRESGQDKRVIYAMISNFQSRIDILENILESIENLKAYKKAQFNETIL